MKSPAVLSVGAAVLLLCTLCFLCGCISSKQSDVPPQIIPSDTTTAIQTTTVPASGPSVPTPTLPEPPTTAPALSATTGAIPVEEVTLKINSVRKVASVPNRVLNDKNNLYMIMNITISNNRLSKGFFYDYDSLYLTDLTNNVKVNQNTKYDSGSIPNALRPGTIYQGTSRTGEVVFIVKEISDSYKLVFLGNNGSIINTTLFNAS